VISNALNGNLDDLNMFRKADILTFSRRKWFGHKDQEKKNLVAIMKAKVWTCKSQKFQSIQIM